jgi:hypothetical protein
VAWLEKMHAELVAEGGSPEAFAELGRGWLTGCMDEVFGPLARRLREDPVSKATVQVWDDVNGVGQAGPDQVFGELITYRKSVFNAGRVWYSQRSWDRFLDGLSKGPFGVRVRMIPMDGAGFPAWRSTMARSGVCDIGVMWDQLSPGWVRFSFSAEAGKPPDWPESGEMQESWAGFVRRQAARMQACAGGMTDDWAFGGGHTTVQRTTTAANLLLRVDQSREALQGYSWVTVIAPEAAARLGGAVAMSGTGAFCEVQELPNEALWLRATPVINDFTGDRVRAVFEALAPVLITGTVNTRPGEPFRLVDGVDAADYR